MTTEEMQALVSMMSTMMGEKIDGLRDELKGEVKGLRDELKDEIRETRVLVEHQRHEIQLIAEKVELINEKLSGLDRMEKQLADHDVRLFALEVVTNTLLKKAQ